MKCQSRRPDVRSRLGVLTIVALLTSVGLAHGAETSEDFAAFKTKALAPLEPQVSRILAARGKDPALTKLRKRLGLIDEVAGLLIQRFEKARSSSLDGLLEEIVATPESIDAAIEGAGKGAWDAAGRSATEILQEYQERDQ